MKTIIGIATVIFSFMWQVLPAQTDSAFLQKYPYIIGKLAFAVDSLETYIGNISTGSDTLLRLEIYNFGKKPIKLFSRKSNRFVSIDYLSANLLPKNSTFAKISFSIPEEMPLGKMQFEAVFETDDKINPYKFLYFSANIVKNIAVHAQVDTVPHIVFTNYNYVFGRLKRGRKLYYTFSFRNEGTKLLIINQIVVDKGIRILEKPQKQIPPGGTGDIRIEIFTGRYIGILHKSIFVYSNDPANQVIVLGIHGTIAVKGWKNKNGQYPVGLQKNL